MARQAHADRLDPRRVDVGALQEIVQREHHCGGRVEECSPDPRDVAQERQRIGARTAGKRIRERRDNHPRRFAQHARGLAAPVVAAENYDQGKSRPRAVGHGSANDEINGEAAGRREPDGRQEVAVLDYGLCLGYCRERRTASAEVRQRIPISRATPTTTRTTAVATITIAAFRRPNRALTRRHLARQTS